MLTVYGKPNGFFLLIYLQTLDLMFLILLNSNESEVEDLKALNEAKLTALKSKLQDLEAVIKSHKGEHLVRWKMKANK